MKKTPVKKTLGRNDKDQQMEKSPRKWGRGAASVLVGSKQRLLDAGVRLFSAHGFDGVSVDEIVILAGVNKRMVYHYFGNKEGLYQAVMERVFAELERWESGGLVEEKLPVHPVDTMRQLFQNSFDFLLGHPDFVRLLLWENLAAGCHLEGLSEGLRKSALLDRVTQALASGERSGLFRRGLDPRLVVTSMIGLCLIYFSNRFTLEKSVGIDFGNRNNLKIASRHACEFFLNGLLESDVIRPNEAKLVGGAGVPTRVRAR